MSKRVQNFKFLHVNGDLRRRRTPERTSPSSTASARRTCGVAPGAVASRRRVAPSRPRPRGRPPCSGSTVQRRRVPECGRRSRHLPPMNGPPHYQRAGGERDESTALCRHRERRKVGGKDISTSTMKRFGQGIHALRWRQRRKSATTWRFRTRQRVWGRGDFGLANVCGDVEISDSSTCVGTWRFRTRQRVWGGAYGMRAAAGRPGERCFAPPKPLTERGRCDRRIRTKHVLPRLRERSPPSERPPSGGLSTEHPEKIFPSAPQVFLRLPVILLPAPRPHLVRLTASLLPASRPSLSPAYR